MTPRSRKYFAVKKYIGWWLNIPIIGYDAEIKQGSKIIDGKDRYYMQIVLYPNYYCNPTTNGDFTTTALSLPFRKSA